MKRALVVAIAAGLALLALKTFRVWRSVQHDFRRQPQKFEAPSPLEGHEALSLKSSAGLTVGASYVPPKNGVAVLLAHGTDTNRTQLWDDAKLLVGAGFGVLLLDWPGMGESEGDSVLGTPERAAFTACVDFLAARPEVKRIGAYGFSNGASLLSAFVPEEQRVTSLLAVNAWTDAVEQTAYEYRGPLRGRIAAAAARSIIENGDLVPLRVAGRLRGRKSLFVASEDDEVVPPEMSDALAKEAGGELRRVPGATHVTFREKLGDWRGLLLAFFAP